MKSIFESAKQLTPELISIRRTLHQYPEIGSILPRTQSFVFSKLEEYGYCPQKICESAVIATISGKQPGKTILLRAEMCIRDSICIIYFRFVDISCNSAYISF